MIFKSNNGTIDIKVIKRSFLESNDYWDANWLESEIKITIPDFTACYKTNLRVDDLQRLHSELVELEKLNTKKAELTTIEEGIHLECVANNRGAVICVGKSINRYNSSLTFELETDLPTINYWIKEIELVIKKYPIIGTKS